jgi:putative glutamine amidotransferase
VAILKQIYKIDRNRPTIGITGPDRGGTAAWFFTALAVRLAGGKPVRITPSRPRTADGLQGIIIGGGADVDPDAYEQEHILDEYLQQTLKKTRQPIFHRISRFVRWIYYPFLFFFRKLYSRKKVWRIDRNRDHLEFQLIDQAVKKNLPVMGICRGAQLINVYFRGSLYDDINTFYLEEPNPSSIFPVKKVYIKPSSKLAEVLGVKELKVNALHHQAVQKPGKNIDIVAREKNRVVQAIENPEHDFILGVQWHPEYLPQHKEQRRLFKALVDQAKTVMQQIEGKDMAEALAKPTDPVLEKFEEQEEAAINKVIAGK